MNAFWRGFEKRAEVLSEFSDSPSAGAPAANANNALETAPAMGMGKRTSGNDPKLGDRYAATGSPRLDRLTTEDRQHPVGGMA